MNRSAFVIAAAAFLAALPAFAGEPSLSKSQVRETYGEEGKATVLVNVSAARLDSSAAVLPLPVAVCNHKLTNLKLVRASFTLIDEQGKEYPLLSVADLRATGRQRIVDVRHAKLFFDFLPAQFNGYRRLEANFFPPLTPRADVLADVVEVPKMMWFADTLYFARPAGDLKGRVFALRVTGEGLEAPIVVRFKL